MIERIKQECSNNVKFKDIYKDIYKEKDYKLNLRKETQHFIIHYTEFDKKL